MQRYPAEIMSEAICRGGSEGQYFAIFGVCMWRGLRGLIRNRVLRESAGMRRRLLLRLALFLRVRSQKPFPSEAMSTPVLASDRALYHRFGFGTRWFRGNILNQAQAVIRHRALQALPP